METEAIKNKIMMLNPQHLLNYSHHDTGFCCAFIMNPMNLFDYSQKGKPRGAEQLSRSITIYKSYFILQTEPT